MSQSRYLLDRVLRRPYQVQKRGVRYYIVKRGVGDIGHAETRAAACAYAVLRNKVA